MSYMRQRKEMKQGIETASKTQPVTRATLGSRHRFSFCPVFTGYKLNPRTNQLHELHETSKRKRIEIGNSNSIHNLICCMYYMR